MPDLQVRAQTCDEELLCCPGPAFRQLAAPDPARIRRIAAELSDGFRRLEGVTRAVAVFGSARLAENHSDYLLAQETTARHIEECRNRGTRCSRASIACVVTGPSDEQVLLSCIRYCVVVVFGNASGDLVDAAPDVAAV